LVCGYLGQNINWHYGFAAAGVGMTLGLIQYALGGKFLGAAGLTPAGNERDLRLFKRVILIVLLAIPEVVALAFTGILPFSPENISNAFAVVLAVVVVGLFGWLLTTKSYS